MYEPIRVEVKVGGKEKGTGRRSFLEKREKHGMVMIARVLLKVFNKDSYTKGKQ